MLRDFSYAIAGSCAVFCNPGQNIHQNKSVTVTNASSEMQSERTFLPASLSEFIFKSTLTLRRPAAVTSNGEVPRARTATGLIFCHVCISGASSLSSLSTCASSSKNWESDFGGCPDSETSSVQTKSEIKSRMNGERLFPEVLLADIKYLASETVWSLAQDATVFIVPSQYSLVSHKYFCECHHRSEE